MNKQQLAAKIWASANEMRSKIEANEYKDYILSFIFYKFLSELEVKTAKENDYTDKTLETLQEEDTEAVDFFQTRIGYFISYDNLYSTWLKNSKNLGIKNGSVNAAQVKDRIVQLQKQFQFPEDSYEARLLETERLLNEEKSLKSQIKIDAAVLHEQTKETIENDLSDEQVYELLSLKWIAPVCEELNKLPDAVIDTLESKLTDLHNKYATTLVDVENDIKEASSQLALMIDDLTANEFDLQALNEFKSVLCNG